VDPSEAGPTTIGSGEAQSKAPEPAPATAVVSRGFTRGTVDRLMLIPGGGGTGSAGGIAQRSPGLTVGANALKGELAQPAVQAEEKVGEAEMAKLGFSAPSVADRRAEAKMKGYVGESCPECANFTLVRNGTCLKCDTCGGTTGCS
jgi:ribonucleoside-diphosphate reductase alpha chain